MISLACEDHAVSVRWVAAPTGASLGRVTSYHFDSATLACPICGRQGLVQAPEAEGLRRA